MSGEFEVVWLPREEGGFVAELDVAELVVEMDHENTCQFSVHWGDSHAVHGACDSYEDGRRKAVAKAVELLNSRRAALIRWQMRDGRSPS